MLTIPVLLAISVVSSEQHKTMDDLQSQTMDLLIKFNKAIFEANLILKKISVSRLTCLMKLRKVLTFN